MDFKNPTNDELMDYLRKKYVTDMQERHSGAPRAIQSKLREPQNVTPEEFFAYMDDKGVSENCPACGSYSLSIPVGSFIRFHGIHSEEELKEGKEDLAQTRIRFSSYTFLSDTRAENSILRPYFMRHCDNCGHLQLFRAQDVLTWVTENAEKRGEESSDAPE